MLLGPGFDEHLGRPPVVPADAGAVGVRDGARDPSDADQVDTILTDARFQGTFNILGHINFYPNGGVNPQPGCGELDIFYGAFSLGIDLFLS